MRTVRDMFFQEYWFRGESSWILIYSCDFPSRLSTIDTTPLMAQARVIFRAAARRPPRSSRAPTPEAQTRPLHLLPETHPHRGWKCAAAPDRRRGLRRHLRRGPPIPAHRRDGRAGGKGANLAACGAPYLPRGARRGWRQWPTTRGRPSRRRRRCTDRVARAADAPSGHAIVMLMPHDHNSVIIVGGANMESWAAGIGSEDLDWSERKACWCRGRYPIESIRRLPRRLLFINLSLVWAHIFLFLLCYCLIILISIRLNRAM